MYFNSRPSARGDRTGMCTPCRCTHFNSRPSARGDCRFACCFLSFCISIHAPPRGATRPAGSRRRWSGRFQFTPLREGRRRVRSSVCSMRTFQFTPLREGRRADGRLRNLRRRISIHAPPRGATSAGGLPTAPAVYFNSRPSARGDRQSTP